MGFKERDGFCAAYRCNYIRFHYYQIGRLKMTTPLDIISRSLKDIGALEAGETPTADAAQDAFEMGMVNAVIPHDELETTAYQWAQEILEKSPTSIKMLKFAMNLTDDGMVGQQVFAGEATRLAYMTDEAIEGRNAFLEKRKPNFGKNKWIP